MERWKWAQIAIAILILRIIARMFGGGCEMTPSDACINLIKRFEGCRLGAYPDPGTGGDPWTIGYGHTGPEVHQGLWISQNQADAYLRKDVSHFAEGVDKLVSDSVPITQAQFDAMCSLAYNIGLGNFRTSTVLRKLHDGDAISAAKGFMLWTKAAGRELPGLVTRRAAEQALFQLG